MPKPFSGDLDHLSLSARQMETRAAEMAAEHTAAHGQIEAAGNGWVGRSAAALTTRLSQWQATVATLQAWAFEHGEQLGAAAVAYTQADQRGADEVHQAQARVAALAEQQNL